MLQPRKRGIGRVILAGMAANACIESHMRERPEQGFEVAVVHDTTEAPHVPDGEGYQAAFGEFPIPCERRPADREVKKALSLTRVEQFVGRSTTR